MLHDLLILIPFVSMYMMCIVDVWQHTCKLVVVVKIDECVSTCSCGNYCIIIASWTCNYNVFFS